MFLRATPTGDRDRGRGLGRGRGHGGSGHGGGSERGGSPRSSDYGYGRGLGSRGPGRGHGRGYRGASQVSADHGGPRGRLGGNRGRGRGVVFEAASPITEAPAVEAGDDVVEEGSYPLFTLPTPSSSRTGPLPAQHVEATGVKRRKYGNDGKVIKLRSNHVEVKLDPKMMYHYDGMYLSYSLEDK